MNALVTGAGGFIGHHLAKALLARGDRVRGLFLPSENIVPAERLGMEIVRGDITLPETLDGIGRGIDIVYHLATRTIDWGTRTQFENIMVGGTRNIINAVAGAVSRFVYFSSIAALGLGRDVAGLDEDAERIKCGIPYCDTKIEAEDLVADLCPKNGMGYVVIRPANVIGPGSVWVRELLDVFRRGPVPLINKGTAPGAFVYIDNLVDGTLLAGDAEKASGRTWHFRDDFPITWGRYLREISALLGKTPQGSIPFSVAWAIGSACERACAPFGVRPPMTRLAAGVMGRNNDVDCSRAINELGWKTRVNLDSAMDQIKNWIQGIYLGSAPTA